MYNFKKGINYKIVWPLDGFKKMFFFPKYMVEIIACFGAKRLEKTTYLANIDYKECRQFNIPDSVVKYFVLF